MEPRFFLESAPILPIGFTPEKEIGSWQAVYVTRSHEKNVAAILEKRGYECFPPLYTRTSLEDTKSELPLVPGYVFCRSESQGTLQIVSAPGLFSILRFGVTPARIPQSVMDGVKRLLLAGLQPEPWPYLALGVGQQVCLKVGPLRGTNGVVVENGHQRWIVLSVHMPHRSVAVKVERTYL